MPATVQHCSRDPLHPLHRASSADIPRRNAAARPLTQKRWLSGLVPPSLKLHISVPSSLQRCGVSGVPATPLDEAWTDIKQTFFPFFSVFLSGTGGEMARGVHFKSGLTEKRDGVRSWIWPTKIQSRRGTQTRRRRFLWGLFVVWLCKPKGACLCAVFTVKYG